MPNDSKSAYGRIGDRPLIHLEHQHVGARWDRLGTTLTVPKSDS